MADLTEMKQALDGAVTTIHHPASTVVHCPNCASPIMAHYPFEHIVYMCSKCRNNYSLIYVNGEWVSHPKGVEGKKK